MLLACLCLVALNAPNATSFFPSKACKAKDIPEAEDASIVVEDAA